MPTPTQIVQQTIGNVASQAVTITGVTAGHNLIVLINGEDSGGSLVSSITSVVDSAGTAQTAVAWAGDIYIRFGIYYVENCSAGSHTITGTWPSALFGSIIVAEYPGLLTSGSFDKASTPPASAFVASLQAGSITPATTGELLIAFTGNTNSNNFASSFDTGLTIEYNGGNPSPSNYGYPTFSDVVLSSASAVAPTVTWNGANPINIITALFKVQAATPTATIAWLRA